MLSQLTKEEMISLILKSFTLSHLSPSIRFKPGNPFYEDFMEMEDDLLDNIYEVLEKDEEINKEKLLELLETNNNYIIGLDNEETKKEIGDNLEQIAKTINHTYRINKLNLVFLLFLKCRRCPIVL